MPGYKAPIKERMLYASCKLPLVEQIEQKLGLELAQKVGNPYEAFELFNEMVLFLFSGKRHICNIFPHV